MPMSIGNQKIEVTEPAKEFLRVEIPEAQVKKLCNFLGISYVERYVRDEEGNIEYYERDGKKVAKTNIKERRAIAEGISRFLAVLCDQLENAKEDEKGVKSVVITYEP